MLQVNPSHPNLSLRALAIGLGLGLAVSGAAYAQAPGGWGGPWGARGPVSFATLDTNGDGNVSATEFAEHRADRMAQRAAQGRPMRNAATAPRFEDWDRNGDGTLSPAELQSGQADRFASRWQGGGPGWGPAMGGGRGRGAGAAGRPCWRNP